MSESSVSTADREIEWVDVRMTDPEEDEWTVDVVTVDGQVKFVDLRVREDLLASFVDCLLDDLSDDAAHEVLATIAERRGIADQGSSSEV